MQILKSMWGLAVVGAVMSAQAAPGNRVRVLGDTMARQVLTRVDPVYPAAALEKGVAGEVVLYAAIGKDGAVQQVAVVYGPAALQGAAVDAVKQWKFSPWLVDGAPVEVDTTVVLNFKPAARGAATPVAVAPVLAPINGRGAALKPSPSVAAGASSRGSGKGGTVDWESNRRAMALPVNPTTASAATTVSPAGGSLATQPRDAAPVPTVDRMQIPPTGIAEDSSARSRVRIGSRTKDAGLPPPDAFGDSRVVEPRTQGMGVVRVNGGGTEWHLIKKAAPEYPQEAVDAGVEGVVLVAGVVKTDGRLRDLRAVSGPGELRQAAVDAAAQYVYEPVMHGDELDEARTQVPVTFTLSGPARVAPDVMAGRIANSFTPPYPPEAIRQGISGAVMLHVLIGRQGQVKDVQAVSGREMLRATAVDAVRQWRYLPYKRNGVDVDVETDVEVQFTLLRQ